MTLLAMSTAAWVFVGIPVLVIWAIGIYDIVRRDLPRGPTAAWLLIVVLLPVIGTIAYFVTRKPTEAEVRRSQAASRDRAGDWPAGARRRLPGE